MESNKIKELKGFAKQYENDNVYEKVFEYTETMEELSKAKKDGTDNEPKYRTNVQKVKQLEKLLNKYVNLKTKYEKYGKEAELICDVIQSYIDVPKYNELKKLTQKDRQKLSMFCARHKSVSMNKNDWRGIVNKALSDIEQMKI